MSAEIEQFAEAIKQLIPISDLSPGAQNDVIEAAEILEFKKKKFVLRSLFILCFGGRVGINRR